MRTCRDCKIEKVDEEMIFRKGKASNWCRFCKRLYDNKYHKVRSPQAKKAKNYSQSKRLKLRIGKILDYLKDHPCIDCGETDPIVLEFDHIRDKTHNVGDLLRCGFALTKIMDEINKCEVRCSNCHTRKTARQFNWWKLQLLDNPDIINTL